MGDIHTGDLQIQKQEPQPVGHRIHKKESKYDEQCCSCWASSETDDHRLQCPKQSRHRNEIYQTIDRFASELDPTLHDILRDGIGKYLGGKEQTTYKVEDPDGIGYCVLQKNQAETGWNNLIRGKFSKHWRILEQKYTKKQAGLRKNQREQIGIPTATQTKKAKTN